MRYSTTSLFAVALGSLLALAGLAVAWWQRAATDEAAIDGREEVVFWHFWGGDDARVVNAAVNRFNASQPRYRVRAVAMPGNNLDVKLFLAIAGGDPPDVVNQDDPIVADWASRGALAPLAELASPAELTALQDWLLPAARRLGTYQGQSWALVNGLDIRALYYNRDLLESHGLSPPRTLAELDAQARQLSQPPERYGFLPDPRRLWTFGAVFGGTFYDERTGRITAHNARIVQALDWMCAYSERYGKAETLAFRGGDQKLPGQMFPLFAQRYAFVLDGQWRVREIAAHQAFERAAGRTPPRFGVIPFPAPEGGVPDAGWVNGNFFVVPRGARQKAGAWEFMKFWCGFAGHQRQAATTCVAGGWIPVSRQVVATPEFQDYLAREPLMAEFVRLSGSENQLPTPVIPAAPLYYREVMSAAEQAMYGQTSNSSQALLTRASQRVQQELDTLREKRHAAR